MLEIFSPRLQRLSREMNACRSGRKPIPGLVYSQRAPGIALRQAWTASMEAAVTCPELAVALRQFDAGAVLWPVGTLSCRCRLEEMYRANIACMTVSSVRHCVRLVTRQCVLQSLCKRAVGALLRTASQQVCGLWARTPLATPYLLGSATAICRAAVLWDSSKRPVEDGKWTGMQLLGRRPGAVPHSWQYLTLGGPAHLPEACPGTSPLTFPCHAKFSGLQEHGMVGIMAILASGQLFLIVLPSLQRR